MCTLSWKLYSFIAVASFSRIMRSAIKQKWLRNALRSWPPNSTDLNVIKCQVGSAGQTNLIHGSSTSQLTGLKGSVANILVLDTTARLQGSSGVHGLIGHHGCFGKKGGPGNIREANIMLCLMCRCVKQVLLYHRNGHMIIPQCCHPDVFMLPSTPVFLCIPRTSH